MSDSIAIAWTPAALATLGLDVDPSSKTPRTLSVVADLRDVAISWTGYATDAWSRRADEEAWRNLRRRIATLKARDESAFAEARAAAATVREKATSTALRCVVTSLFPGEGAWARADLEASLAEASGLPLAHTERLLIAIDEPELAEKIVLPRLQNKALEHPATRALEMMVALGTRAVPLLKTVLEDLEARKQGVQALRQMIGALEMIATPEVAEIFASRLARPDARAAAARFFRRAPELAVAALAPVATGRGKVTDAAKTLLKSAVAGRADLAVQVATTLDGAAKRSVESALVAQSNDAREAELDALPLVLSKPPWRNAKSRRAGSVKDVVVVDVTLTVDGAARTIWQARVPWVPPSTLFSSRAAHAITHLLGAGTAKERDAANAWIRAYPELAAVGLIPGAVSDNSARRLDTGRLLRLIASFDRSAVDRAIARYHADVGVVAREIVALEPLEDCPLGAPKLPELLGLEALPRPRLRDRDEVLPLTALQHLCEMLTFTSEEHPYAGLEQVKAICDADSLDVLACAIVDAWQAAGAPPRMTWPMNALAAIGGPRAVRKLGAFVRSATPSRSDGGRGELSIDLLARLGTDVALVHLAAIADRSRYADLKERAKARIAEVARVRGLTEEELADRVVPDLDLDPDGSLLLDFGPRSFRVGFDDHLAPFVRDNDGARLQALPRATKADDPERSSAATARWKELREDGAATIRAQAYRFEAAMCSGRSWSAATFRDGLAGHPLLGHLVRRLVWSLEIGDDQRLFRVAEDRTLADVTDTELTLPDAARVTLPHPIRLDAATITAWSGVLGDYQIAQPFAQLAREVLALNDTERATSTLSRFYERPVEIGRLFALEHKGYRRLMPSYDGAVMGYAKTLPGDAEAIIALSPGFHARAVREAPPQSVGNVHLARAGHHLNFGELSPLVASELLRDLTLLTA